MTARRIGDTVREAVDWTQDLLGTTRPVAEQVVLSSVAAKQMVWDDGVYLLESDLEVERRKVVATQNNQKNTNNAKRWSRIHFRNHNRNSGKNSLTSIHKQAASKFSDAAEDMLASLVTPSLPVSEDDNEIP